MDKVYLIALVIIVACVLLGLIVNKIREIPIRRAGKRGERIAANVIKSVLREGDRLFNNVALEYDGKPAEFDNIVVNDCGVFIIEVKNYVGKLYGTEDDYEWTKVKTTDAGNSYEKKAKNPIRQVKRQTYILANYLESHGCDVWVEGRAFMINGNSPVKSPYMLWSIADIDKLIHTPSKQRLNKKTVEKISKLLDPLD